MAVFESELVGVKRSNDSGGTLSLGVGNVTQARGGEMSHIVTQCCEKGGTHVALPVFQSIL